MRPPTTTANMPLNGRSVGRSPQADKRAPRATSPWLANLTTISGLAVALNETLARAELRPSVVALAAMMMFGVDALDSILDRMLAHRTPPRATE